MLISGMSGNEIFCLSQKGYAPGEIAVGNSVCSLGLSGALASWGRAIAGGEIAQITEMVSGGRHAAIQRMEDEARRQGAVGVTSVVSELRTLAGYAEFLSQGTGVHRPAADGGEFFSTAASGMELYCHLDAGYRPIRFAMGNVAYALGVGRGLTGTLRTIAKGEVREYSQLYNRIRHLALRRLRAEAAKLGANAVVDVAVRMLPYGPGTVELLMTGTASHHGRISSGPVSEERVVTSELRGEELWNLARMGWVPVQLVMATSVYSIGLAAGVGTLFQAMQRGELPEVTRLVYHARENCLELLRKEAIQVGAEQVIGNKLMIQEVGPGLIEVVAIGTAVRRAPGFAPETPQLLPQAIIVDRDRHEAEGPLTRPSDLTRLMATTSRQQFSPAAMLLGLVAIGAVVLMALVAVVVGMLLR